MLIEHQSGTSTHQSRCKLSVALFLGAAADVGYSGYWPSLKPNPRSLFSWPWNYQDLCEAFAIT